MKECAYQKGVWLLVGLLALLSVAGSQLPACTGFEAPSYTGSSQGDALDGQNGWLGADLSFRVFTYLENAFGLPVNPTGERQFIGAMGEGHMPAPRAHHDFAWRDAPTWTVSFDFCVGGTTGTTLTGVGGFALEPDRPEVDPVARTFSILFEWKSQSGIGRGIDVPYKVYYADGNLQQPAPTPGEAWRNLRRNNWYRLSTTFSFNSNRVLRTSITDLGTGTVHITRPEGWYLEGGADTDLPFPNALSFFGGFVPGPLVGHPLGIDNVCIVQAIRGDIDHNGCVDDTDLLTVLFAFGQSGNNLPADVNEDGVVNDEDLLILLFNFGNGC
jgi:hypothetical protein